MIEQAWIIGSIAGVIAILSLIAFFLFAPPRPSMPQDGPVRILVRPLKDLDPDPQHLYLGDGLARDLVNLLQRYERVDAAIGDGPARFVLQGSVRKSGQRLAMNLNVTSSERHFWKGDYDSLLKDVPAVQAKAIEALARIMKLSVKADA